MVLSEFSRQCYFLQQPIGTSPNINADGDLLGDYFSIYYGQWPFSSYFSTNLSGQRFGNSLQQSVSTRHYFHDANNLMGNIVHTEGKGMRDGQHSKNIAMEKVTILKHGETINNDAMKDRDKKI